MAPPHTTIKPGLVRCHETSTTMGTGTLDLIGAVDNHTGFVASIGTTNTCEFVIQHQTLNEWERSIGVVTDAATDTLSRTTILDGSGGLGIAVNFSAGTKDVFITPSTSVQPFVTTVDPAASDDNNSANGVFLPGQLWINTTSNRVFSLVDDSAGAAKWVSLTSGFNSSSVLTISGGAVTISSPGVYRILAEGGAGVDQLDTISGAYDGMQIALLQDDVSKNIMLTDNGNIQWSFDNTNQRLLLNSPFLLIYNADVAKWQLVSGAQSRPRQLMIDHDFSESDEELTIVSGAVTLSGGVHTIDTQSDAAADDLDTISGSYYGVFLLLKAANSARTVTLTDAGNIRAAVGTPVLGTEHYTMLYYDDSNWLVLGSKPQGYSAATDGATITFDLDRSRLWEVTLGDNRTLALSNEAATDTEPFLIVLEQDGTGTRTVTWFAGIEWPAQTAPTLTTTANRSDAFVFVRRGAGDYMGFTLAQDFAA